MQSTNNAEKVTSASSCGRTSPVSSQTKQTPLGAFLDSLPARTYHSSLQGTPPPTKSGPARFWGWCKKTKRHWPKWTNTGCVFSSQRAIAWRILDAQYFGLAQRRKRVFLVASARNGFDPTKVLFEFEGVRRDSPPSREAWQEVAGSSKGGANVNGEIVGSVLARTGMSVSAQDAGAGHILPVDAHSCSGFSGYRQGFGTLRAKGGDLGGGSESLISERIWPADVACTLNALFGDKRGLDNQHINGGAGMFVRGAPPTVHVVHGTQDPCVSEELAFAQGQNNGGENVVCFQQSHSGELRENKVGATLTGGTSASHRMGLLRQNSRVRKLTPVECERLQGFPDNHTRIPYRNKPAEDCPDGPRYKTIGNSKAVPCIQWVGARVIMEWFRCT